MADVRKAVALLSVSAACVLGIFSREAFEPVAVRPLPGDRCTNGYGGTFHEDGTPIQCGETITEPEARKRDERQIRNKYEAGVRRCTGDLKLLQREWDFLADSAYNLGVSAVCNSSMVREFRAQRYQEGCAAIKLYKYGPGPNGTKLDCTIKANKCGGIPKDRERAYKMCMGTP